MQMIDVAKFFIIIYFIYSFLYLSPSFSHKEYLMLSNFFSYFEILNNIVFKLL